MADLLLDIKIEPLDEGGYLALCDDLPGLLAEGRTFSETMEIAGDVARKLIELYIEKNIPLPDKILKQINLKPKIQKFKMPVAITL